MWKSVFRHLIAGLDSRLRGNDVKIHSCKVLTRYWGLIFCAMGFMSISAIGHAATGSLHAEALGFYYRPEADVYYLAGLQQFGATQTKPISFDVHETLAKKAFDKAERQGGVERPLKDWRAQGGHHPWVIYAKVRLMNGGTVPLKNLTLNVSWNMRLGEWRVDREVLITDYAHLKKTSKTIRVEAPSLNVPSLAPGETKVLATEPIELYKILAKHPKSWPSHIEVNIAPKGKPALKASLELVPDHFITPGHNYPDLGVD